MAGGRARGPPTARGRGCAGLAAVTLAALSSCASPGRGLAREPGAARSPCAFLPRAGLWMQRGALRARTSRAVGGGQQSPPPGASPFAQLDVFVDNQLAGLKDAVESDTGKGVAKLVGEERFESVKASVLGVAFAVVPEAVTAWLDPDRLTPRWEFQLDMLALDILLFSLVYRYAVREGDDNPMQKMGVLSAFVLPRALFLVEMPAGCTPAPLTCGPPLGYFSWPMLAQVAKQLVIGGVTLGAALYGLERSFRAGLLRRFRGGGAAASPAPVAEPAEAGWRFPWQP
uniref:Uncharacterized protein n=1 Tax=Alexandrium monilatum TaxID=311494 RepID=A0A7S4UGF6_9DINO